MVGFELLLAHLTGDYIFQNDWQALNKTRPLGRLQCFVHCVLYTLAIWLFTFSWMPWWGLLVCFVTHYVIDRNRLAYLWMTKVSGQSQFATGPCAPWSIIVVDNYFHLLTLYAIYKLT